MSADLDQALIALCVFGCVAIFYSICLLTAHIYYKCKYYELHHSLLQKKIKDNNHKLDMETKFYIESYIDYLFKNSEKYNRKDD